MITEAQKILIYGMEEDIDLFYERAQKAGCIEFIRGKMSVDKLPEDLQVCLQAMKELRRKKVVKGAGEESFDSEELFPFAKHVLQLRREIELLEETKRMTQFELVRIAPFGDFSAKDVAYIESHHIKMQFFCAKAEKRETILSYPELIYLTTEDRFDYYLSLSPTVVSYSELLEIRIDKPLGVLSQMLQETQEAIHKKEQELQRKARLLNPFQTAFYKKLDAYHLDVAKNSVDNPLDSASLFCVEAWVPISKQEKMVRILSGLSVHFEKIKIESEDSIPTILENGGITRVGEDLVRIYDCPATNDKDPSGWVFWSFALFFAIIIADAGYGLLYLAIAAYLKYKFRTFQGGAKRMFRLLVILSCFVVGWGIMTMSFFGLNISQENILRKISPFQWLIEEKANYHLQHQDDVYHEWVQTFPLVAQAKNGKEFLLNTFDPVKKLSPATAEFSDNLLLECSLFLGFIHISLSLLRYCRRNGANIGWVVFLIGGYLAFPSAIDAISMVNVLTGIDPSTAKVLGKQMIYAGMCLAMVIAMIQQGWKGIKEIMNLVQVFGDVLSYLRLYALALAGAIMASTFNDMGEMVGVILGSVVIILGHAMNIGLGLMAGVIHGLRLNFIEWYHYSFVGGGRYFNPLRCVKSKEE